MCIKINRYFLVQSHPHVLHSWRSCNQLAQLARHSHHMAQNQYIQPIITTSTQNKINEELSWALWVHGSLVDGCMPCKHVNVEIRSITILNQHGVHVLFWQCNICLFSCWGSKGYTPFYINNTCIQNHLNNIKTWNLS